MKPALFATASTARSVAQARAAVLLVGGYDGSGNYGDIALLEAALELVQRLGPDLLALPVLERVHLDVSAGTSGQGAPPAPALFFDPEGAGLNDGLVAVPAPTDLAFGACYLYGGGYLNGAWGDRRLAMLGAAETLLKGGGADSICRLASGLQADGEWIASLVEANAATLRSFDFLGVRDEVSASAIRALGSPAPVSATGDDAVGLLRALPAPRTAPGPDERLQVNLHLAAHEWVSEHPQAVLDFYAGFLAELGRIADRPLVAQPLIAYLDRNTDERDAAGQLDTTCSALGIAVAEPLLLRPATLADIAPRLSRASLTLSCSYHVALTSLLLEVPALLVGDNAYYEQKAAGLAADFELPSALTGPATADPLASAREVAGIVLGGNGTGGLRPHLAAKAIQVRRRRSTAEADLLARLGAAAVTALSGRAGEMAERLRLRSAEPAQLLAQLAALRTEQEEPRRPGSESDLLEAQIRAHEAELRAQELAVREAAARAALAAEQATLAALLRSRSWRAMTPLRWAASRLHGLGARLRGR